MPRRSSPDESPAVTVEHKPISGEAHHFPASLAFAEFHVALPRVIETTSDEVVAVRWIS
jgi:hypothetical protein